LESTNYPIAKTVGNGPRLGCRGDERNLSQSCNEASSLRTGVGRP
jgi:hypothetical protein